MLTEPLDAVSYSDWYNVAVRRFYAGSVTVSRQTFSGTASRALPFFHAYDIPGDTKSLSLEPVNNAIY